MCSNEGDDDRVIGTPQVVEPRSKYSNRRRREGVRALAEICGANNDLDWDRRGHDIHVIYDD